MALDKSESDLLANASVNVMREFDITPDPKAEAIIGLIIAAGTVYGPRYVLIKARKAEEKQKKGEAQPFKPSTDDVEQAVDITTIFPTVPPGFSSGI